MMKNVTPEQAAEGMKPWMEWAARCGDSLVDMGAPLTNGQLVTDGGSVPSEKEVTGFSILEATDMGAAVALLQGHPHLSWTEGCSIEVYEAMPLTGM